MDPSTLAGILIVAAIALAAWTRGAKDSPADDPPARRVVVEELDPAGRVTRRVVL